jgi:hypothetical protein
MHAPCAHLCLTASRRRLRNIRVKCGLLSDAVAFGLPLNDLVAAERSEAALGTCPNSDEFGYGASGGSAMSVGSSSGCSDGLDQIPRVSLPGTKTASVGLIGLADSTNWRTAGETRR